MTQNGHENNKEHLFLVRHDEAVRRVVEDFEKEWAVCEVVGNEQIVEMMKNKEKKGSGRRDRSVSRSLCEDLDSASGHCG